MLQKFTFTFISLHNSSSIDISSKMNNKIALFSLSQEWLDTDDCLIYVCYVLQHPTIYSTVKANIGLFFASKVYLFLFKTVGYSTPFQ